MKSIRKIKISNHIAIVTLIIFSALFSGWIQVSATEKANAKTMDEKKKSTLISVMIINRGAKADEPKIIKKLLALQGNLKVKIGQDKGPDFEHTLIVFREERFKVDALNVRELLIEKEQIYSEARIAATDEEKSADIVIMLGKLKSAPPQ